MNEKTQEALIIDPGYITPELIMRLEKEQYKLSAILVTHNHGSHVHGIEALTKIYSTRIYGADESINNKEIMLITGDGHFRAAGFSISYYSIPGHTIDSLVYKIGNILFTGDSLSAGHIGNTNSTYSNSILKDMLQRKVLSQNPATVVMPGHGPPTTIEAERAFNLDVKYSGNDLALFSLINDKQLKDALHRFDNYKD